MIVNTLFVGKKILLLCDSSFDLTVGSVGAGSGDILGSILAVIAAITQGLFFSLIRYKYAKGVHVSNMDIMCYNLVAAFAVCVGRRLLLLPADVHGAAHIAIELSLSSTLFLSLLYPISYFCSLCHSFAMSQSEFAGCEWNRDSVLDCRWRRSAGMVHAVLSHVRTIILLQRSSFRLFVLLDYLLLLTSRPLFVSLFVQCLGRRFRSLSDRAQLHPCERSVAVLLDRDNSR